ncbi:MAG: hypothetical protein D6780_07955, partial [Candidatus Dadabacteria bacterium]
PTKDNQTSASLNGYYCRTITYIDNSINYEVCPNDDIAYKVGKTCAVFEKCFLNYHHTPLQEVIPDFHNFKKRYTAFHQALESDPLNRAVQCKEEISSFLKLEDNVCSFYEKSQMLPSRICHNDPKLNNFLFAKDSLEPLALIDLDTCMETGVVFDFGDMVRSVIVESAEDCQNLELVSINDNYFKRIAKGYLDNIGDLLTKGEKELLSLAPFAVSCVLGVRFLTDYLLGDRYFTVNFADHNLVRARVQLKAASLLLEKSSFYAKIIDNC